MKKSMLIILTGLFIFGCGEKNDQQKIEEQKDAFAFDTTDIKASPVDNPYEPFYMRYKLKKGKTYNFRLTAISTDDQTITSTDTTLSQDLKQTMIYNMKLTPSLIDSDSTMELEAVITSIKMDGTVGNESVHYQSGVNLDSADISKYAQYESLIQNPFEIRISKVGELLDLFRTDKIVTKLLDIRGYTDSLKSEEKAALKNDISEGLLKPIINQVFRKLPLEKVAKDSAWKVEQPVNQMMVFQTQNTSLFKITGIENLNGDLIVDINAGLDSKFTGKNKLTDRGVNYEFHKPVTSGEGKIYFNLTKGLVQKTKLKTSITLSFDMESRGQKGSKKEVITNTNILEYIP